MRSTLLATLLATSALALASSCGAPVGSDDSDSLDELVGDGKQDRDGVPRGFAEVDPTHTSASFRRYVNQALLVLRDHPTEIGRLTYASIVAHRVRIDELVDLTCADFRRALADTTGLSIADYARLHDAHSGAAKQLTEQLNGYMWGDRIYVARGLTSQQLAATLVHEVNHVLNRSEIGYYDDLPSSAFREEYRAFFAERTFDPRPFDGLDLVAHVIELYDLDRDGIDPSLLKTPLTPRLLPSATAWQARGLDPADDERSSAADCR